MLNLKKADRNESWCTLSIDKTILTAKIQHMGRGRFKILAAEIAGDKYINKIVDASDVFSCKRE
jgi:hypothetical protein